MLIQVLRKALQSLRKAGWPALLLGLLYLASVLIILPEPGLLLFVGIAAQNLVTFALVRYLAARGGVAAKADGPPLRTRAGRIAVPVLRPGPVTDSDKSARRALRNAASLARPAIRLSLVQLIGALAMIMVLLALAGDNIALDEKPTEAQIVRLLVGLAPIAALFSAFVALAPQRIALEGDHRVMLAVLQSIRLARRSYGTVFALSFVEPLMVLAEVSAGGLLLVRIGAVIVHAILHVVVVAALNEVYDAGPALELPKAADRS